MAATRELEQAPGFTGLYARAAMGALPGADRLPLVGRRGDEVPDTVLALRGVQADPQRVADYARACGFALRDTLPPTYPHIVAFPLHLALMTDRRFPFPVLGVVHIANRIVQRRPLRATERFDVRVEATPLKPHPKGRQFTLVTEVRVEGRVVWESVSTNLRRGGRGSRSEPRDDGLGDPAGLAVEARWDVGEGVGRRYAGVSGDRNPIHLHALTARAFGFPRAIAHGMWTKARVLAALEPRLPDAFAIDVRFAKPLLLPSRVELATAEAQDGVRFAVRAAESGTLHVQGATSPPPRRARAATR